LQCGFVRSNFSFAILLSLCRAGTGPLTTLSQY